MAVQVRERGRAADRGGRLRGLPALRGRGPGRGAAAGFRAEAAGAARAVHRGGGAARQARVRTALGARLGVARRRPVVPVLVEGEDRLGVRGVRAPSAGGGLWF